MIKDWYSFYTPKNVAEMIIDMIPAGYNPKLIVDICAGSGNFLEAALSKWNTEAVGVDIQSIDNLSNKPYTLHLLNALDINNLNFITHKTDKLVLANPPFGKMDSSNISFCYKHSDLQEIAIKSKRIETNMIVSNMSLLKSGEIFAAILPENIFSSEKLIDFRRLFLSYFEILHMGDPEIFFRGSEVKTRVFIGRYIENPLLINKEKVKESVESIDYKIIRGLDNSKIIKKSEDFRSTNKYRRIIHFSNNEGPLSKFYIEKKTNQFKLDKTDIMISRVGRNSGKVFKVDSLFVGKLFSDYFYVVKNIQNLIDEEKRQQLENILINRRKGLTAKYICKKDIKSALSELNIQ